VLVIDITVFAEYRSSGRWFSGGPVWMVDARAQTKAYKPTALYQRRRVTLSSGVLCLSGSDRIAVKSRDKAAKPERTARCKIGSQCVSASSVHDAPAERASA
jgi:hypothetical protein